MLVEPGREPSDQEQAADRERAIAEAPVDPAKDDHRASLGDAGCRGGSQQVSVPGADGGGYLQIGVSAQGIEPLEQLDLISTHRISDFTKRS